MTVCPSAMVRVDRDEIALDLVRRYLAKTPAMRRWSWIWFVLVLGAAFSASVANAEEAFAVVPVAFSYLHFFAPVSVNGSKIMWFGIDTEHLVSFISPEARQALSLPAANSGPTLAFVRGTGNKNAVVFAQSVKSMDMELGPGYLVEAPIAFKTERSKKARGTFDKAGLLGMDFLLKRGAVINCRTGQIFFSRDAAKLPLRPERYEQMGFSRIPIRITPRGFVEVDGTISGSTYSFLINTGFPPTLFTSAIQKRAHSATHRIGFLISFPHGGIQNGPVAMGKLPGFKLGDHDMSDFEVSFGQLPSTDFGFSNEWGGEIGTELLIKQHAIIDLGNRALYLMADKKK